MAIVLTDGDGLYYTDWDTVLDLYVAYQHVAEVNLKHYGPRLVTEVGGRCSTPEEAQRVFQAAYEKFKAFGFDVAPPDQFKTLIPQHNPLTTLRTQLTSKQLNRIQKHSSKYFYKQRIHEEIGLPLPVTMWGGKTFWARTQQELYDVLIEAVEKEYLKNPDTFDFDEWSQTGEHSPEVIRQRELEALRKENAKIELTNFRNKQVESGLQEEFNNE